MAFLNGWPKPVKLFSFGKPTVIAAHSLFCTALVVEIVLLRLRQVNRGWLEASADLYATRARRSTGSCCPSSRRPCSSARCCPSC